MNILCIIGARGGSKGLPNKNIRPLLGKPLIGWSIEQALSVSSINKCIVSTDSEKIASIARSFGAETPFVRPQELSNSTAGKFQVWKHALVSCESFYKEKYDLVVDLDCTNPLRDSDDILNSIKKFNAYKNKGIDAVFTVCDARKNPYFNMVEYDKYKNLKISKNFNKKVIRRQDAPRVLEHVASIYVLSPNYILKSDNLLNGRTKGYNIGQEKSFDIDSEFDFKLVEFLMKEKIQSGKEKK